MESNNSSNSANNIYYGREDYEEDDDVYKPFNIPKEIFESSKVKSNQTELSTITKGIPDSLNITKAKKSKKKAKESTPTILPSAEPKVQQAGFYFSHSSVTDLNKGEPLTIEDAPNTTLVDSHRINVDLDNVSNVLSSQMRNPPEQIFIPNALNIPIQHYHFPPQRNTYPNVRFQQNPYNITVPQRLPPPNSNNQFLLFNQSNFIGSQLRQPIPVPLDYVPNVNYSLTTTYNHRLQVVDTLFRFIMQILRSPEPPPPQQIDSLKQMLDSLMVPKPPNAANAK